MRTLTDKGELVVYVCPTCKCHTVCDPLWAVRVGQTIEFECYECSNTVQPCKITLFKPCEAQGDSLPTEPHKVLYSDYDEPVACFCDTCKSYYPICVCEYTNMREVFTSGEARLISECPNCTKRTDSPVETPLNINMAGELIKEFEYFPAMIERLGASDDACRLFLRRNRATFTATNQAKKYLSQCLPNFDDEDKLREAMAAVESK